MGENLACPLNLSSSEEALNSEQKQIIYFQNLFSFRRFADCPRIRTLRRERTARFDSQTANRKLRFTSARSAPASKITSCPPMKSVSVGAFSDSGQHNEAVILRILLRTFSADLWSDPASSPTRQFANKPPCVRESKYKGQINKLDQTRPVGPNMGPL